MKKYIIVTIALAIMGCSDEEYANLNVDPTSPSSVPASFLFTNGTKSLFDQMGSTSVNLNVFRLFSQYWTETQYIEETNYDIRNRAIPDTHWNIFYTNILYDLKLAKESVTNDPEIMDDQRGNQLAMITCMEVYAWQQMVDTFGDIPYSEALMGAENTVPKYDDAATVYSDLLEKITAAYNQFDGNAIGFENDFVFGNDISKWKKLAASIKFKIAMQLADVNPSLSKQSAEDAYNKGLIASNADNFILRYENNPTNANPLYADLVLSGRQDFIPANTYVDYLNNLEDPRRAVFFDDNIIPYIGGIYGSTNTYTDFTHIGDVFYKADLEGDLLDFSEISFLLAEAAERGYAVAGSAASHYTAAVTANMEYWGIEASEISAYLSRADVDYNSAPGTWKEKIGKQFWIAMYNRGFEGWTVWRKFDAPQLNLPDATNNPVPVRFTYPVREMQLNEANYNAASSAIGGDEQSTKLFWDIH